MSRKRTVEEFRNVGVVIKMSALDNQQAFVGSETSYIYISVLSLALRTALAN
jgi:hypothetical protein